MSNRLRQRSSLRAASNFSLVRKGAKFWNALPWKSVNVSDTHLGEFDDAIFLGLEEVDGNAFLAQKKEREEEAAAAEEENDEAVVSKDRKKKRKRAEVENDVDAVNENDVIVDVDTSARKTSKKDNKKKAKAVNDEQNMEQNDTSDNLIVVQQSQKKEKSTAKKSKKEKSKVATTVTIGTDNEPYDVSSTGNWGGVEMNGLLCESLQRLDFVKPTPIQFVAIPKIIANCMDIVGVAETGSGKTLVRSTFVYICMFCLFH